ncbi:MAG TPA: cell division topological specificity factor MinE [Gammaproteobacteria bacterium]|nr:cell division topological specificity factor MinE [Gammaproteobacteria bacterium]
MRLFDLIRPSRKANSADIAKERLQIVIAHQRTERAGARPAYFANLQRDLLEVVRRYVPVGDDAVQIDVGRQNDCDILELKITLPEHPRS